MKQTSATLLGFFCASVLPAVYMAVVHPLSGEHNLRSIFGTFFVHYIFTAAAALLVGLPTFLLLRKARLVTWWTAMTCGALAGILAIWGVRFSNSIEPEILLQFAILGAIAGLAFWGWWRAGAAGTDGT